VGDPVFFAPFVAYPTDSELVAKTVRRIAAAGRSSAAHDQHEALAGPPPNDRIAFPAAATPMELHLRLMFLKVRYRLGYESRGCVGVLTRTTQTERRGRA
jgi:hypothetical protein